MRYLKWVFGCVGVVAVMCLCFGAGGFWLWERSVLANVDGDIKGEIEVDGQERTFWIHLPNHTQPERAAPLMIVMHGGGGSGAQVAGQTRMSEIADREGFIVVYPNGTGGILDNLLLTWNAGNCCGSALENEVDDVAFLSAMIDYMIAEYNVDPARVYSTGLSNGAMMSYRIGCELSDKITAIAPVAGALNNTCAPTEPLSVLIMHGTDDQHVLYEGGAPIKAVDRKHPRVDQSVAYAVDFWVGHNQCDSTPTTTTEGEIITDTYSGCAVGTTVELITIDGGGHAWPGGERGSRLGDEPTTALDASEVIWAFFADKTK